MINKIKLPLILCLVTVLTAALITGCNDTKEAPGTNVSAEAASSEVTPDTTAADTTAAAEPVKLGEGELKFSFTVTEIDGNESAFEISTDKTNVGDALLELGLIEGEEGPYGLYVKKVNGILADYDTDGTYWSFYIDGEYAMTGVDTTEIKVGGTYSFKVEK